MLMWLKKDEPQAAIQIRFWQLQIPTLEGYTNSPLGFIRDSIDDSHPDS